MEKLDFHSFIDIKKWDSAKWLGTGYIVDQSSNDPPCLLLVFENGHEGKSIFSDWINMLGNIDKFEELRVAIIEGDIPGEDPGYSVVISSNPLNTVKSAEDKGVYLGIDKDKVMIISRVHRMNLPGESPHLRAFKQSYLKHNMYRMMPASAPKGSAGQIEPHYQLAIEKTEIRFRNVKDISEYDQDAVIFRHPKSDDLPRVQLH